MIVGTYAQEILKTNVTANSFNPGQTRTKMRAQAMPGENEKVLQTPEEVAQKIVNLIFLNKVYKGKIFDILQM